VPGRRTTYNRAKEEDPMYVRPKEIARALGVSAHDVRVFLRAKYPSHKYRTNWYLDAKMVVAVVAHFVV